MQHPQAIPSDFVNPDFQEAPFVEAGPSDVQYAPAQNRTIIDFDVQGDQSTMKTWQKMMSEIAVIQRLETKPSAQDIVRMIEAANSIQAMSAQLVSDMQEHRNDLLRALGVEVPNVG